MFTRNKSAKGTGLLAIFGLACAILLLGTNQLTAERIAKNKRIHELQQITSLVGSQPTTEPRWIDDTWQLCSGVSLVRARAPGYGGPISAVVAHTDGRLRAIRVTAHQETPGIADFVTRPGDPWRAALRGHTRPGLADVDTVAGATITSRALLALLDDALAKSGNREHCGE